MADEAAPAPAAAAEALEAEAEYHDGQQARPLWLRARLAPGGVLELRRAGGEAVAAWPVPSLRVVDRAGGALRLAVDGIDARLLVSDPRFVEALDAALGPRRRVAATRRLRLAVASAVAVPLVALGVWHGWPPAADAIARAVPVEWEQTIGAAAAAALIGSNRVCGAPEGQAALDRLAARLAAAGGVSGPLRVRVVDDRTVNAFAAPGGEVVVFRGLLDEAGSADELAGVLAHEIGHVEHRHGLRGVVRAAGLFALTSTLTGGSDAAALGATLATLANSRDFEREADATAARILSAAGIGSAGLQRFFARMEKESGPSRGVWGYLSTHPAGEDRAAALRGAEQPAAPAPALSTAEWTALRRICGSAKQAERRPAAEKSAGPVRAAAAARVRRRRIGTFGDWEAWVEDRGGKDPICYALAHPATADGEPPDRKTKLWVTHRPWFVMDDISFVPENKPLDGTPMALEFGGRRGALLMRSGTAWPRDTAALSAALRAAAAEGVSEVSIAWSDAVKDDGRAPARSHRFALGGLVEAHAAISEACRAGL